MLLLSFYGFFNLASFFRKEDSLLGFFVGSYNVPVPSSWDLHR
jgi:hypothetical protein